MTNGSFHPDNRNGTPNAVTGNDGSLSPADYANWPKPGEPTPGTAMVNPATDMGAALPRNGTPSSGDLPLPLPPAPVPATAPLGAEPGAAVEGAHGADGSGGTVPAKVPSWLRIGGKGAQARAAAEGGVPSWLTGRSRADRKAVKGPGCPRIDDRRVLAALRGSRSSRNGGAVAAGARALVKMAMRAGIPRAVFGERVAAAADASTWAGKGMNNAANRWVRLILGPHATAYRVIRAIKAKHGIRMRNKRPTVAAA